MELFGILSAISYNISGLLISIKVVRQGHADNIMASIYLVPWFLGSVTGTLYAALEKQDLILTCNFGLGVVFGLIIIFYKIRRRNGT